MICQADLAKLFAELSARTLIGSTSRYFAICPIPRRLGPRSWCALANLLGKPPDGVVAAPARRRKPRMQATACARCVVAAIQRSHGS